MSRGEVLALVWRNLRQIIRQNRSSIGYLLYYSILESVLLLVAPLASAFIINSVLAHATISILVLSFIVITVYLLVSGLKLLREYMIEKFEQKIFVENAIKVASLAAKIDEQDPIKIDKYMNYFFDVVSIQKLFPLVILNGSSLVMKVAVSLVLLLAFDLTFFLLGLFFLGLFFVVTLFIGKRGVGYAIERSDAKHEAIHFLQRIPFVKKDGVFERLDELLVRFVKARNRMFRIIAQQRFVAYFTEGLVMSIFFIVGGYLVFKGAVPIGEFVAVEIIIITVMDSLRDFMKQIDYLYDMIEGFYKIDKLERVLADAKV